MADKCHIYKMAVGDYFFPSNKYDPGPKNYIQSKVMFQIGLKQNGGHCFVSGSRGHEK